MLLCGQLGGNGAYDDDDYADCLSAQRERVHIYFIHVICCSICAMWEHVCVPSGCLSSAMYFYLIFFCLFGHLLTKYFGVGCGAGRV